MRYSKSIIASALVLATATQADTIPTLPSTIPASDTYVVWDSGPCIEPVLLVETDRDNVRAHIPDAYPGSDDEFMSHLVTTVGLDGRLKATVVLTLNRCEVNRVDTVLDGRPVSSTTTRPNTTEVLVMLLWDGPSTNAFEFYALRSYVDEPRLAAAFTWLGLPTQHTPGLTYQLDADVDQPAPGAVVPFTLAVPDSFRVDGSVVRPLTYGPVGHATHHYHGPHGEVWVEHDAPTGGLGSSSATVTVTGSDGAWLQQLLGASQVTARGFYLEPEVGHEHTSYLID